MRAQVDDKAFIKQMNNIVQYGIGFVEGIQTNKPVLLKQLGLEIQELASQYVDANARVSPQELHHVYEWYQTGSPSGRLFNITYTLTGRGLSFGSTFSQSKSVKNGSNVPFYDKARIMEQGTAVTISPKQSDVLAFEVDGEQVFTKKSVTVTNPGGNVSGAFEDTFNEFFRRYLSQSFLEVTGLAKHFKNPVIFKQNFAAGAAGGKSVGVRTGQRLMASKGSII